jgi:hypothetical protein
LFSEFAESSHIILLGDPGAGKTRVFQESAAECAGTYVTVRDFLNVPSFGKQRTLFIDGLDERRSGRGDDDTVDAIVQKLFALQPERVRLSCRVGIWLGESDLSALRAYFDNRGGVTVVALEALSDDERSGIIKLHGFEPDKFVEDARQRGLDELLGNPQNLILLCEAVRKGRWPLTRKELYGTATDLLLTQPNKKHAQKDRGIYVSEELRDAAGAACAARLIGGVSGLSLDSGPSSPDLPCFRSLKPISEDLQKLEAALGRRTFRSIGDRKVDYSHRTVAEYLAAEWLANRIRAGLPIGRVLALTSVDGQPAAELRALHAWLVVHLPEYAGILIDADPFGALSYGDAAPLSVTDKQHLLGALERLSETDPWFRAGNWSAANIGALSDVGLADAFRRILSSKKNFSLRSIVLDALAHGCPVPALLPDLRKILAGKKRNDSERSRALAALVRLGAAGKNGALEVFEALRGKQDEVRLRCEIITQLYGSGLGATDVVSLIDDTLKSHDELAIGTLWHIVDAVPIEEAEFILDGIAGLSSTREKDIKRRNGSEVIFIVDKLIMRVLRERRATVKAPKLWQWLCARREIQDWSYSDDRDVKEALAEDRTLQQQLVNEALISFELNDEQWRFLSSTAAATMHAVVDDDLLEWLVDYIEGSQLEEGKRKFLYELAMRLAFRATPRGLDSLDRLISLGEQEHQLGAVRDRLLSSPIETWQKEEAERKRLHQEKKSSERDKTRKDFKQHSEAIRSGAHLGWLGWLGQIYLALFADVDEKVSGRERLIMQLGEEYAELSIEGLVATTLRADPPTVEEVFSLLREGKWKTWWAGFVAGLDERSARGQDVLSLLSREALKGALAVDLRHIPRRGSGEHKEIAGWKQAAFKSEPETVRDTYLAVVQAELRKGDAYVHGLHEVLTAGELAPIRHKTVVSLVEEFADAPVQALKQILRAGLGTSQCHETLVSKAKLVASSEIAVAKEARNLWLVVGYLLDPDAFGAIVEKESQGSVELVWLLREMSGHDGDGTIVGAGTPNIAELARMTRMAGKHFPYCASPTEWNGDSNAWDGSRFVQGMVDLISADASSLATVTLEMLAKDKALKSHRDHVRHALANQRAKRREAEYRQPSWDATIASLSNGKPANAADLHALVLTHLDDIAKEIADGNVDTYKEFWNEDPKGKITTAKNEESCRDALIRLLRRRLQALGVIVEPEGHMANDKRADIAVFLHQSKVVIELKREVHPKVWVAASTQLDRFYTRDPQCTGYGIYGVFWFGHDRAAQMAKPPNKMERPDSAGKMKEQLEGLVPISRQSHLAVVLLDVSGQVRVEKRAKKHAKRAKRS